MKKNIKKSSIILIIVIAIILLAITAHTIVFSSNGNEEQTAMIQLPSPRYESSTSVEEALKKRRSARSYKDLPLTLEEVSQLLFAAYGVTEKSKSLYGGGFKTVPSAGALYSLEIYLVAGNVNDLPEGVYRYVSAQHSLKKIVDGDVRYELRKAALRQQPVAEAPAVLVISAVYDRITSKYGKRGIRYSHIESGHAAQNIYLQAQSLNVGTVVIGAFEDAKVKTVLGMSDSSVPLIIMPVGKIQGTAESTK